MEKLISDSSSKGTIPTQADPVVSLFRIVTSRNTPLQSQQSITNFGAPIFLDNFGVSSSEPRAMTPSANSPATSPATSTEAYPDRSNAVAEVGIIMGSDSDLPTMEKAIAMCEAFQVAHDVEIVSAHRTPERMMDYAQTAHQRGLKVIIAGAGGAAHLPGMVAALTPLPVIGVPVASRHLQGLDSLYSIVQMPRGIPVATVAIGNATNAGLLAVQILASQRPQLLQQVQDYRRSLKDMVREKQSDLSQLGYRDYLQQKL